MEQDSNSVDIYDGIIRKKSESKGNKASINKTYLELIQNKNDVIYMIHALKTYYTKLVPEDTFKYLEFYTNPESYVEILKEFFRTNRTFQGYGDIEENEVRIDIVRGLKHKPRLQSSKYPVNWASDFTNHFSIVITVNGKDKWDSQVVIIDSENEYDHMFRRGVYDRMSVKKFTGYDDESDKDVVVELQSDTSGGTIESPFASSEILKFGDLRQNNNLRMSIISVDFLYFLKDFRAFVGKDLSETGFYNLLSTVYKDKRNKGNTHEYPLYLSEEDKTKELEEIETINNLLFRFTMLKKGSGGANLNFDNAQAFATKLSTKKNRPLYVDEMIENSMFTSGDGFGYVEYDEDINQESTIRAEMEFTMLVKSGILPKPKDVVGGEGGILRIRKLGREKATGMYVPDLDLIIIDKYFSFIHEYGHMIDYNSNWKHTGLMESYKDDFKAVRELYTDYLMKLYDSLSNKLASGDLEDPKTIQRLNLLGKSLSYYSDYTEIFARSFEHYLKHKGLESILLGSVNQNLSNKWLDEDIMRMAYESFEYEDLNAQVISYFDNRYSITSEQVSNFNKLRQEGEKILVMQGIAPSLEKEHELNKEKSSEEIVEPKTEVTSEDSNLNTEELYASKQLVKYNSKQTEALLLMLDDVYDNVGHDEFCSDWGINVVGGIIVPVKINNSTPQTKIFIEVFLNEGVEQQTPLNKLVKVAMKAVKNV